MYSLSSNVSSPTSDYSGRTCNLRHDRVLLIQLQVLLEVGSIAEEGIGGGLIINQECAGQQLVSMFHGGDCWRLSCIEAAAGQLSIQGPCCRGVKKHTYHLCGIGREKSVMASRVGRFEDGQRRKRSEELRGRLRSSKLLGVSVGMIERKRVL